MSVISLAADTEVRLRVTPTVPGGIRITIPGPVSGGGGGAGVTSVNGDNGPAVTLTAADVGADPAGTAASIIEVVPLRFFLDLRGMPDGALPAITGVPGLDGNLPLANIADVNPGFVDTVIAGGAARAPDGNTPAGFYVSGITIGTTGRVSMGWDGYDTPSGLVSDVHHNLSVSHPTGNGYVLHVVATAGPSTVYTLGIGVDVIANAPNIFTMIDEVVIDTPVAGDTFAMSWSIEAGVITLKGFHNDVEILTVTDTTWVDHTQYSASAVPLLQDDASYYGRVAWVALGADTPFNPDEHAPTYPVLTGLIPKSTVTQANVVMVGTAADTPSVLAMGASTILARLAAGDVVAATPAQLKTLLSIAQSDVTNLTTDLAAKIPKSTVTQANVVMVGTAANTPAELPVAASRMVARLASGDLVAATVAEIKTLLDMSASDVGAQPADADLTAIATLTTAVFGRSLLEAASAAAARVLMDAHKRVPGPASGQFIGPKARAGGTSAMTSGRIYWCPMYIGPNSGFDQAAFSIVAAGSAGAVVHLGLYNDDGYGRPGTLVANYGTVAADVGSATPTLSISQAALTPGLYWTGALGIFGGGPVTSPGATTPTEMPMTSATASLITTPAAGFYLNSQTSLITPASFTGVIATTFAPVFRAV